ncbi:hypothetical protein [Pseudarthrobacter sp. NamB4]|uniref:hypothetical protein n=1 Tax=Pseudarthrobacter sp. NamB4 TaxID=2576837 RepID=UPI0010FD78EB|nr:hypothetical protein [Pseudarthrobacter sp. NamB4]TLM71595.1 hypothetical protein FDW81_15710 [Pseudarthrobacter sp. NamB4]
MPADILTLHTAMTSQAEAARRRAMLLHPSNFNRTQSDGSEAAARAEQLATRFKCLHEQLTSQGLPEGEARTEVARIAAREVWNGFAAQLRHHRAAGHQMDASVLAVALSSIQGLALPLVRHAGDVTYASRAVSTARRRLQYNGGLLHRLHPYNNPAFSDADATLEALEAFLARSQPKAA